MNGETADDVYIHTLVLDAVEVDATPRASLAPPFLFPFDFRFPILCCRGSS